MSSRPSLTNFIGQEKDAKKLLTVQYSVLQFINHEMASGAQESNNVRGGI
jgi:hypothetical protein